MIIEDRAKGWRGNWLAYEIKLMPSKFTFTFGLINQILRFFLWADGPIPFECYKGYIKKKKMYQITETNYKKLVYITIL